MKEMPSRQMDVIGTHMETGEQVYFRSAYYEVGLHGSAISGRAKSHRGFTWRYATKKEREQHASH